MGRDRKRLGLKGAGGRVAERDGEQRKEMAR